jgi:hypothetical protein
MAFAGTASAGQTVGVPQVALPKLRWPRLSRRSRALLMMGLMVSPAFISDDIGYCVERLFMTADQIAMQKMSDDRMPAQIYVFHVACPADNLPVAEKRGWAEFAARKGWQRYPQAGPSCFKPDHALYGVVGLKSFNVACPELALTVADQRRWIAYAANHGWTEYSQAGVGCVDP